MDFSVFETPAEMVAHPSDMRTSPVMLCCCINRGDVTIEATVNKNFYHPGEPGVSILDAVHSD
eukprot:COSAG01_NODE_4258_length_5201_cov_4.634065_7_plen_63_part_00